MRRVRSFKRAAFVAFILGPTAAFASTLSIDSALSQAMASSPEIAASRARADAEHGAIRAQYSLENPRFGLMRESNMNLMEMQMGPMNIWSISQEFKFPTKYFLMGSAQKARARASDQDLSGKKLEVRQKLISAYYNLFSVKRVISLLEAQRETLREVARSAEARHATGAVPQQDEMKAHVEQTKIETDILSAREEEAMAEASLNALMNRGANEELDLPAADLMIPSLKTEATEIEKIAFQNSRQIKSAEYQAEAAGTRKSLAGWNYAPDFMLSYKKGYGNAPSGSYSVGLEISVPLWFVAKQSSEYSAAAAEAVAADRMHDQARVNASAEIKGLISKVVSHGKLLEIYQTALIPQATSTLTSSRGAYQAGRANFLELLDSERSLYAVRIAYYRSLSEYVEYLTKLEQVAGASLSTLPIGDSL